MPSWAVIVTMLLVSTFHANPVSQVTSTDSSCIVDVHYFSGTALYGVSIGPWGSMLAVRFTPPRNMSALIAVRFYVLHPFPFNVQIFSRDRKPMLSNVTVVPVSAGWTTLDLSETPMIFDSDFYVALEFLETRVLVSGAPLLAAERGNPSGRNYDIFHIGNELEWLPNSSDPSYNVTHSYLIEASFATGPYLRIDSPAVDTKGQGCYSMGETVEISTTPSLDDGNGRMLLFEGWSGDYSGNSTTAAIRIEKFVTSIKADYRIMYRVDFASQFGLALNGSGWYKNGSIANLSPPERLWIIFTFQRIEMGANSSISGRNLEVFRPMRLVAIYQLDIYTIILLEGIMIGASLVAWGILRYRRRRASRMIWFRAPKS